MKIKALVPFSNGTISMEQYEVREVADSLGNELISAGIAVEIGGGGLPPVTETDNGKVLTVDGGGTWSAAFPDNTDRRIIINATLGNDGNLTTNTTINFGAARMLFGGCYLYVDIYDTDSQLIERVQMHPICQENVPAYLFYEGQYVDLFSTSARRFVAYFANPNSEDASTTVYLQWKSNKFIVTLTPTAQDYSGTMDKTVAEINAAYKAGRKIVFKVILSATDYLEGALTAVRHFGSWSYDDYIGNIVLPAEGMLITVETLGTDDGTKQTYSTHVYTLTPAT